MYKNIEYFNNITRYPTMFWYMRIENNTPVSGQFSRKNIFFSLYLFRFGQKCNRRRPFPPQDHTQYSVSPPPYTYNPARCSYLYSDGDVNRIRVPINWWRSYYNNTITMQMTNINIQMTKNKNMAWSLPNSTC